MLVVMLGSVTGAWAQIEDVTEIIGDMKWQNDYMAKTLTFSSVDLESESVAMPDYCISQLPWGRFVDVCKHAKFINISHIGSYALQDAFQLQSIEIPYTVTSIGEHAFYNTHELTSITIEANTPPSIDGSCFNEDVNSITVYIPSGTGEAYKSAEGWKEFTNFVEYYSISLRSYVHSKYGYNLNPKLTEYINKFADDWDGCNDVSEANRQLQLAKDAIDASIASHQHNYVWTGTSSNSHESLCGTDDFCIKYKSSEEQRDHEYDETAEQGTHDFFTCSVCGYQDPIRQHVHHYELGSHSRWHWYFCTSTIGTCPNIIIGIEDHTNGSSITDDSENYHCTVCGYENATIKAEYDARDYMSMTAKSGNVVVGAKKYDKNYIPSYVIQYSLDRVNWTNYATANDGEIVTIPEGETYYFRSGMPDVLTSVMDQFWNFTMTGTGTIEAGGNVMSLLDRSCQSLTVGDNAFRNLFDGCTPLTVAPKVPATTLGEWCYTEMFNGCTQLQKAPHLPAATLKYYCYGGMFDGCSSLDYVEADFTEAQRGKNDRNNLPFSCATEDWLNGTAANGLLVMKREMIEKELNFNDAVSITSGWQRALKVKANEDPDHKGNFYTTFYDGKYSFDVIGEAKAYSGSIEEQVDYNELQLTATPNNVIPKEDGVLLHSPSSDIVLAINGGAEHIAGNVLTGSDNNISAPAGCYILSYGQNGLGFYRYASGKALSAHKAYFTYANNARPFVMVFNDGEETAIKQIENEKWKIENSIYNLSGQRLNKLQKGINIVNGKKVIIK